MAEVILKDVCKVYEGKARAVDHIDLEIKDREFMVLVGPSGCGKSTTLRMIAGLEEISDGTIRIGNKTVNHIPPKDRDIAMVFQNYALYPHMTVYENMAFGLKLRKLKKSDIDARVRQAAEMLGLTEYLPRRPKALSGGQRQRVAVGRAIVRKPEVFLFDEPLSNLDAKMRVQMRTEISKLHSLLQTTMIYVTHDQIEAMTMGDRICVMKDGRIQQVDTPLAIYDNPANVFVAGFIGTPPMNFFHGCIAEANGGLHFQEADGGFMIPLSGSLAEKAAKHGNGKVIFGIRPEDISRQPPASGNCTPVKSCIEVIEPMGAETYLYLNTGQHPFIARVDARHPFRVNDTAALCFNLARAHIFDAETQVRLS